MSHKVHGSQHSVPKSTVRSWSKMDYTFNVLFLSSRCSAYRPTACRSNHMRRVDMYKLCTYTSAWHYLRLLRAPPARWSSATLSLFVVFAGRFGLRVASRQQCLRRHLEEMGKNEVLQRAWDGSQNAMDSHALSG